MTVKDKVLTTHPVLGEITVNDLIQDLEIMLIDTSFFEDFIYQMIKSTSMSKEDISTLFNYSVVDRLKWIISVLKDLN
jgi:hypothetical protein